MKDLRILVLSLVLAVVLTACSDAEDNFPGSEYMPDMGHSLAVEANTYNYYYYNTWDEESTIPLAQLVYPRGTVEGTVPRGYAGAYLNNEASEDAKHLGHAMADNAISVPTNGHVPYYYDNTVEGRLAAMEQLTDNPFPITEAGLAQGKKLYDIFCGICHGSAGNGLGYIYDTDANPNAAYPLAPANFLRDEFYDASNGRYYHAIVYGYNAMGAYADKISYEERWQVIHYIRSLQAKELKLDYNQASNTFRPEHGMPAAEFDAMASRATDEEAMMEAAGQLSDAAEAGEEATEQMRKK